MTGWLITIVYFAGLVVTARKATMTLIEHDEQMGPIDTEDRVTNRITGVCIAIFWPLVLAGALVTGKLPKSTRQRQEELDERERRIAQLERDLGIEP